MALASNTYGTVAEVETFTKHLRDDGGGFDVTSTPTLSEVEAVMDRISGVLNTALSGHGFTIPISNATAVLACDEFVVKHTVCTLRASYPHLGIAEDEGIQCGDTFEDAYNFAKMNADAFKRLGETVGDATSQGLAYTGLNKYSERSDPDNDTYEQPKFRRGLFDA